MNLSECFSLAKSAKIICLIVLACVSIATFAQAEPVASGDLSAYYGFGEMEIVKLTWGIKCLGTVDMNNDGLTDIVAINNKDSKIEILLQKAAASANPSDSSSDSNDADINELNAPTKYTKSPVPVSIKLANLVCGDFNGDGLSDLAFYGEPAGLYVLIQESKEKKSDKSLTWKPVKKFKIDDGLLSANTLECADIDNDGKSDLILAGADGIYILLQKDKGLGEPVKYATTTKTLAIRVGDLDGDKHNDLLLVTDDGERPIQVRFGLENGQLGPQIQMKSEMPSAIVLDDYDRSGAAKVMMVESKTGRFVSYKFVREKASAETDFPILYYPLPAGKEATSRDMEIGDFDGDGLVDVIVSDPAAAQLLFYKQVKGLGLDKPVEFPAFANIASICAAKLQKKSPSVLGVLSVKEKTIGISRFEKNRLSFPKPLNIVGEPLAMQLSDVDNDGNVDCAYVSRDANDVRWLRTIYNIGDENAKTADAKLELKGMSSNPDGMRIFDADNDGLKDVIIFVSYDQPVFAGQKDKRSFSLVDNAATQMSLIKEAKPTSINLLAAGDGTDLLIAQQNFARSLHFVDDKWTIVDQFNAKSTENTVSAVAGFDLDNDGMREILLVDGQKGELQILKAGENKTYRFDRQIEINNWNIRKMFYAPIGGGDSIVLFDNDKFALISPNLPLGRLVQQFSYETTIKEGKYANLTASDLNSDKVTDFVLVEFKRNHLDILTLDKDLMPAAATRFKVFEQKSYRESDNRSVSRSEPSELEIADVTGDGKNDLVTVIHDRIIVYPQD